MLFMRLAHNSAEVIKRMISMFQLHTRWRFYSYHRIPNCFT